MLGERQLLSSQTPWDLIVVGGGITGAGILLEAARRGLRVLLLEQQDFAWGTSSRSSKMVHGGLRYLAQGDLRLTRHALHERERLLRELPGLVQRADYLFPLRRGRKPGRWPLTAALFLYDTLAGIRDHRHLSRKQLLDRLPGLDPQGLRGAMCYSDALTDDCRLVMRVLLEAGRHGGEAINYARVEQVQRQPEQGGFTVTVADCLNPGQHYPLTCRQLINATGAWADRLSQTTPRVRPLRGSHLFIDPQRLPVRDCVTVMHPDDGRPVFVFPWEGVTCVGTTDLDHRGSLNLEPSASASEVDYLLRLINSSFPQAKIDRDDIWATMAGVRPVIASGKGLDPSRERRDHAVWQQDGIVTVSGGKLTTFRLIALDALHRAGLLDDRELREAQQDQRQLFRPLAQAPTVVEQFLGGNQMDADFISWVLCHESVVNLDDLMLRRTRLGLLRPNAAQAELRELQPQIMSLLGWDEQRWQHQLARYLDIHRRYYGVPAADGADIEPLAADTVG